MSTYVSSVVWSKRSESRPTIAMAPLLAAVANKQYQATERLLDAGADPNHLHPLFGSPVHARDWSGRRGAAAVAHRPGGRRECPKHPGPTDAARSRERPTAQLSTIWSKPRR